MKSSLLCDIQSFESNEPFRFKDTYLPCQINIHKQTQTNKQTQNQHTQTITNQKKQTHTNNYMQTITQTRAHTCPSIQLASIMAAMVANRTYRVEETGIARSVLAPLQLFTQLLRLVLTHAPVHESIFRGFWQPSVRGIEALS